jgi:hypothetical protein
MNFIKISFLTFIFAINVFPQEKNGGGDCNADLNVETDSRSSVIFINGSLAGSGNLRISLPHGRHIITAKKNVDEWNAKTFTDTLLISDCREYKVGFIFSPDVYLKTDPQDVSVYSGGILYGHTPLFINTDSFKKRIELKKEGYQNKVLQPVDLTKGEIIKLNYTGKKAEKSFFEKDIFKILAGSMAVLGATTAYFKLKADDEFENYQFNGSSSSLDNTRRYDLISGISFAALQINFGVLIYFFLFD